MTGPAPARATARVLLAALATAAVLACSATLAPGARAAVRTTATATAPGARAAATATSSPTAPAYVATPPTPGALESDGQTSRYLLGGTWLYEADPTDSGVAAGLPQASSTAGWSPVTVPNAYNAGDLSAASMAGSVGWYRRDFVVPSGAFARGLRAADNTWLLEFESVNYRATVWLNGTLLGTHAGAYLPFQFPLGRLRRGVNRIVVRVDDRRGPTDFPAGPSGGWWNFGGILDAVYLLPVAGSEIDSALIRPVLPCPRCAATIDERPVVRNLGASPQRVSLTGRYGTARLSFGSATIPAGGSWSPSASVVIARPRLWAPGDPQLYRATLTLTTPGPAARKDAARRPITIAGYAYESGIREIHVGPTGQLTLNGRILHLRGVSLHEQTVATGAALSVPQLRQLIDWTRQLGATIIRAHYPLDPELEEMADQDGILLWSEVPVYGSVAPVAQTASVAASAAWRARAVALVQRNIAVNQNHPSILTWSIGNELPTPPTVGETAYIRAAAAAAHAADPTRPVTMAISDWPGVACQSAYAPLDMIGVNEYFGWYDAGGGTTDDTGSLGPFLQSLHACYSHQALMVSEFGFGSGRAGPAEAYGTYGYQDAQIAAHVGVFDTLPWLSGAIYFALQDFAVFPGFTGGDPLGVPSILDKGVIDRSGDLKPAFGVLRAAYAQTVQIGR